MKHQESPQMRRVARAISQLVEAAPFWGTLALCLKREETHSPQCPTMGTDGVRLAINPAFVDKLNDRELRGVIAHEVSHVARDHMGRLGNRDQAVANIAGDYAINCDLIDDGFTLPETALIERRYKGWSMEDIYADLMRGQRQQQVQQQQQQNGDDQQSGSGAAQQNDDGPKEDEREEPKPPDGGGSGESGEDEDSNEQERGEGEGQQDQQDGDDQGSDGDGKSQGDDQQGNVPQQAEPVKCEDPGGCGGVMPAPSQEVSDEWQSRVVTLARAMMKGEGKVPASIAAMVREMSDPRVSWREAMRRFITQSTQRDYSWTKPNRRHVADGVYLPSLVSDGRDRVVAIVDISGSIDMDALAAFRGEVQQMLDEQACDRLTVVYADTKVQKVEEFEAGDLLTLSAYAGGGTNFAPAIEWAVNNADDAACIVYLTDLDCSVHGKEPTIPVLWAAYGKEAKSPHYQPPFGEVVHIDAYDR